mmetsp:Transcript_79713/g.165610  ORF Transcript_79713/g.165610 Transcript_79713/m.165610 type:complete len:200 (+) Transcript_79713:500-1099(+)
MWPGFLPWPYTRISRTPRWRNSLTPFAAGARAGGGPSISVCQGQASHLAVARAPQTVTPTERLTPPCQSRAPLQKCEYRCPKIGWTNCLEIMQIRRLASCFVTSRAQKLFAPPASSNCCWCLISPRSCTSWMARSQSNLRPSRSSFCARPDSSSRTTPSDRSGRQARSRQTSASALAMHPFDSRRTPFTEAFASWRQRF